MITLRQAAIGDGGDGFSASLPAIALAGSLLISCFGRNDNGNDPSVTTPGWGPVGSGVTYRAHPSFGGVGRTYWKLAVGGEQVVTWSPQQGKIIVAELIGLAAGWAEVALGAAFATQQPGQELSLVSGIGRAGGLAIAGFVTRLNLQADANVTPAPGVNRIPVANPLPIGLGGNGIPVILWRESSGGVVTLAGTQSGNTQDGYHWGGQLGFFAGPPGGSFAGEPGGGVW